MSYTIEVILSALPIFTGKACALLCHLKQIYHYKNSPPWTTETHSLEPTQNGRILELQALEGDSDRGSELKIVGFSTPKHHPWSWNMQSGRRNGSWHQTGIKQQEQFYIVRASGRDWGAITGDSEQKLFDNIRFFTLVENGEADFRTWEGGEEGIFFDEGTLQSLQAPSRVLIRLFCFLCLL